MTGPEIRADVIRTTGLTKRYGRVLAVDGVDLQVAQGDRYGFLGPNGSGKTTTVRMLLGLVFATAGRIEVLGRPVPRRAREVLPHVGALVEGPAAYPHLSASANLALIDASGPAPGGRAARRVRIDEALELVGLDGVGRRPVRAFSLGMRQRLGIAGALLRRPRLLVLDEPTNGLDPQGILEMRDLLVRLNGEGTTVFLSSHVLGEVEQLCTRVGVMDRGRLVAQESLADLRGPTGRVLVRAGDTAAAARLLDRHLDPPAGPLPPDGAPDGAPDAAPGGGLLAVRGLTPAEVARALVGAGIDVHEVVAERQTLEDVVLRLTGPGADRVARVVRPAPAGGAVA